MTLLVAAEKIEFQYLLSRAGRVSLLSLPIQFAADIDLSGYRCLLAANGPGPRLAGDAVDAIPEHYPVTTIVSTGFCGGLNPALRLGDIVVASQVLALETNRQFPTYSSPSAGTVLSQDRVASTAAEKHALYQATGADAVEMEAAAVARKAAERDVPFHCIRVVSDTAQQDMPLDFNAYRDDAGRFQRTAITMAALRRPFHRIPALLNLQKHCLTAAYNLGEYLAHRRY